MLTQKATPFFALFFYPCSFFTALITLSFLVIKTDWTYGNGKDIWCHLYSTTSVVYVISKISVRNLVSFARRRQVYIHIEGWRCNERQKLTEKKKTLSFSFFFGYCLKITWLRSLLSLFSFCKDIVYLLAQLLTL